MSLKMKLTSAFIMFMLAIATLVIGVLAAQTQSINMEGTINFEISDRSLYVKNVHLEDPDGSEIEITSFMPGYINDGITLSLGTHTVSNTSFKIHFDLINTTALTYDAGEVTLSSELQSANVIATASGTISPTTEDIPEGEDYAPITDSTPISGTITLAINSPNTTSIDLNGITVEIIEHVAQAYEGFSFANGALTGYTGSDTEIVIPTSYSLRSIGNELIYSFQNKDELLKYYHEVEWNRYRIDAGCYWITPHGQEARYVQISETSEDEVLNLQDDAFPLQIRFASFTIPAEASTVNDDLLTYAFLVPFTDVIKGKLTTLTIETGETVIEVNQSNYSEKMNEIASIMGSGLASALPMDITFGEYVEAIEGDDYTVSSVGVGLVEMAVLFGINNPNITTITIPNITLTFMDGAFDGCQSLTTLIIESQSVFEQFENANSLGNIMNNTTLTTIKVSASIIDGGASSTYLDSASFSRSDTAQDGYYVYTKI